MQVAADCTADPVCVATSRQYPEGGCRYELVVFCRIPSPNTEVSEPERVGKQTASSITVMLSRLSEPCLKTATSQVRTLQILSSSTCAQTDDEEPADNWICQKKNLFWRACMHRMHLYIKGCLSKPRSGLTSPSKHETKKYYVRYDVGLPQLHKFL